MAPSSTENGNMLNKARSKENLLAYKKTTTAQLNGIKDEKTKKIPPMRMFVSGPAIEIRPDVSNRYSPEENTTPGAINFTGRTIENKEKIAIFGSRRKYEVNPLP